MSDAADAGSPCSYQLEQLNGNRNTYSDYSSNSGGSSGGGSDSNSGGDGSGGAIIGVLVVLAIAVAVLIAPGALIICLVREFIELNWDKGQMWTFSALACLVPFVGTWIGLKSFRRAVVAYCVGGVLMVGTFLVCHYGFKYEFPKKYLSYYWETPTKQPPSNPKPERVEVDPNQKRLEEEARKARAEAEQLRMQHEFVNALVNDKKDTPLTRECAEMVLRNKGQVVRSFLGGFRIELPDSKVTDEDLRALVGNQISSLTLENTAITDAGLLHLKGLKLSYLNVKKTKVTSKGIDMLRQADIWMRIEW